MDPITSERIRQISQSPFAEQGFPVGDPDPLDLIVGAAGEWVLDVTGHGTWEAVPTLYANRVTLAIKLAVEMTAAQSTPEYLETLSDFDLIQSFSAGSYSETRRTPLQAAEAAAMLAAWPPLNAALLNAMTPEKREEYLALLSGKAIPAVGYTEVDWSGRGDPDDLYGWTDPMNAWSREW
jgi:hypothetical protein